MYQLRINNSVFDIEIADKPFQQFIGLSNRSSMPLNYGMLFVYKDSKPRIFNTLNMKFSLDFLWIDYTGKIVNITENVIPEKQHVLSNESVKYILEINSGETKKNNIQVGDKIDSLPDDTDLLLMKSDRFPHLKDYRDIGGITEVNADRAYVRRKRADGLKLPSLAKINSSLTNLFKEWLLEKQFEGTVFTSDNVSNTVAGKWKPLNSDWKNYAKDKTTPDNLEKQRSMPCPVGYHEHANIQGCHEISQHHRFEHRSVGAGVEEYTFLRPESEEEDEQLTDITIPAIARAHGISLDALWENLKNLYGKKLADQKYQEQKYTPEGKLLTYSPIHLTPSQIYTAHFLAQKIKRHQLSRSGKVVSIKPAVIAMVLMKQFPWFNKTIDLDIRKQLGDDIKMSVKAIIEDQIGRVLILKSKYSDFWDLPGGHVANGEVLEKALVREVKEETNLDVVSSEELFARELTLGTETKPVVFYKVRTDGTITLSSEHASFRWVNQEQLEEYNLGVFAEVLNSYFSEMNE